MIYCDTSLIVAAITPERFSAEAQRWFDLHVDLALARTGWTGVEIASALARKTRSRAVSPSERVAAELRWRNLASTMRMVKVGSDDLERAAMLVDAGPRGLRAGDALQLAIALGNGFPLATLDRDLADAAEAVGVEVMLRPPA